MTAIRVILLIALLPPSFAAGCVRSEVTPLGQTYPARPENCEVDVFPSTTPRYPWVDVASVETKCHFTAGRSACIERLKAEACKVGADAVYGFAETKIPEYTVLTATLARKTHETPARVSTGGPDSAVAAERCAPPCSPGYQCEGDTCKPLCNPPCPEGSVCGSDRSCRAL